MLSQETWEDINRRIDDEMDFERIFYEHHHEAWVRK